MKALTDFFKTCLLGGLFVLLPLLLFYLLITEALGAVVALATPIADLFPEGTFDRLGEPVVIAAVLILTTSFVFGLALRSRRISGIGSWIEKRLLAPMPMYEAVKHLATGFEPSERGFRSGLLSSPDGIQELVYLVEQHDDGRATVLVPWAPLSFSGSVKVVPSERLEILPASLGDTSRVVSLWGVGMRALLKEASPTPSEEGS